MRENYISSKKSKIFSCLVFPRFAESQGSELAWSQGNLGEQKLVGGGLVPGQNSAPWGVGTLWSSSTGKRWLVREM